MLTRIVKMTFDPERIGEFQEIFEANKHRIGGFEGCESVVLLRDINQETIFFTYSHWKDEAALNNYRNSETFREIWGKTKPLFSSKAEAWSVTEINKPEVEEKHI